jgi:hypothetical protein
VAPCGGANEAERGGARFGNVDQHGTDAAALGHSDSGGRCPPRGHGGRAVNRGGRRGVSDAGATADKWGRAVAEPGGQRRGAGEIRENG